MPSLYPPIPHRVHGMTVWGLHRIVFAAVFATAAALGASGAAAQSKPDPRPLVWRGVTLESALYDLADASGASFVFAHRLTEGLRVSGTYKPGEEPDATLAQLLRGSGLRATRIRRGRYVIIAEPLNVTVEPDDPEAILGVLEGDIVDADTGEPLWGAHAWLVDLELGGVADDAGQFAVPDLPTGTYTVRFSHVGYRPVRVRLSVYPESSQLPPTIRLQPEISVTDDATVDGRVEPEPQPGLTDLATRQAAALPVYLGEGDLVQTLDWLPGLARAGAGGGALVVRGADPHLTRYLRDDVPIIEPWHAFGLFSAFQPEALERIRFHRGSLPPQLGGGLAAVVQLDTKDGLTERPAGIASVSPVSVRAVAEVPVAARLGLMVAARRSTLDWLFSPTLRQEAGAVVLDPLGTFGDEAGQDVGHRFSDGEAKLTWVPSPRQRVALGGYLGADRLDARLGGGIDPDRLTIDDRWTNGMGSLRYRYLGRRSFVTATAYHTAYGLREETAALDAADRRLDRDYRVGFRESGARVDVDYFRSLAHEFRFGGHAAHQALGAEMAEALEGQGSRAARAESDGVEVSAYVQDSWKPSDRWRLQTGLRVDAYTAGRHVSVSPRLAARYTVRPERLYLRAGLSRQTQPLHRIRDRYAETYDLAASRWLLPSERVRPASAWQAGVGMEWAPGPLVGVGVALGVDAYVRTLHDVIEPLASFEIGRALEGPGVEEADLLRYYRPTSGRAAGLEMAVRGERGPWVLGVSYALARAEMREVETGRWHVSRYDRPHVLGLLVQRGGTHWSAAARLTVQSGLPYGRAEAARRFPVETRLDLAVGYRFEWAGLRWDAQAQAFNLAGPPPTDGPPLDGTAALLATDVRGLPVVPVLSLKASW